MGRRLRIYNECNQLNTSEDEEGGGWRRVQGKRGCYRMGVFQNLPVWRKNPGV